MATSEFNPIESLSPGATLPSNTSNNPVIDFPVVLGDADAYFANYDISTSLLRVTYDFSLDPYAPYRQAHFGILVSVDGSTKAFVGFFEPLSGGLIQLINIPLQGQSLGALANSLNALNIVKAEVLQNAFLFNSNCLVASPLQRATNAWSFFFKDSDCTDPAEQRYSTLRYDVEFMYTSVEHGIEQTNASQSLGGFASPTGVSVKSKLTKAASFYKTMLVFEDDALSDADAIQIGEEIITISSWQGNKAVVSARGAYSTPTRFHPEGFPARAVKKNDVFNSILNGSNAQYRCMAIRNSNLTDTAKDVKLYFKYSARNPLSEMNFAIEIPRNDYCEGTASSGTNSVFASPSLKEVFVDDHFASAPLTFTSGKNSGQTRIVSAYKASSGQITLEEPLPFNVSSGDGFYIDSAPAQLISSSLVKPSVVSKGLNGPPYLISDFSPATLARNGVSINVGGQRAHGGDMRPRDVVYVWFERKVSAGNEDFINSRSAISVSFNRI